MIMCCFSLALSMVYNENIRSPRNQFVDLARAYPKSQYRDEAMFQQAQFEIEQGNYQAAVDGLTQLIRSGSNSGFLPYAYMRRGASYFNLKQYDKTIGDYTAVIQQFPSHPVARGGIASLAGSIDPCRDGLRNLRNI